MTDAPAAAPPSKASEPVMYLVVNTSLGMSAGKVGAQCAHAAAILALRAAADGLIVPARDARGYVADGAAAPAAASTSEDGPRTEAAVWWRTWLATSFKKIVLAADQTACEGLEALPGAVGIHDAGHTQVAAGSLTVVGFPPMPRADAPRALRGLKTL